jgi:hypothetical protein
MQQVQRGQQVRAATAPVVEVEPRRPLRWSFRSL